MAIDDEIKGCVAYLTVHVHNMLVMYDVSLSLSVCTEIRASFAHA